MDRVYDLFPVLGERRNEAAGLFSGGEQQMLAIGRAMMSRPKLLMLDEPSMGLSPIMTQTIMRTIRELQADGVTILLVEQNAQAALSLADRGYVLEVGPDHVLRHRHATCSATTACGAPTSAPTDGRPRRRRSVCR